MKKNLLSILAMVFTLIACAQPQPRAEYPRPQFTADLSKTEYAYDDIMSEELYAAYKRFQDVK